MSHSGSVNELAVLDIELLRSFVAVVEARSFTKAAERVHRTQSTVSQQIRKLEMNCGTSLLIRTTASGQVGLTEDGETLLPYAQRILTLAQEAQAVIGGKQLRKRIVRLGLPEDFSAVRLTALLASFARAHPGVRVDTVCGLTAEVTPLIEIGELDLALIKREVGAGPAIQRWSEDLVWVGLPEFARRTTDPVPLAVFPQGCLYRERAIRAIETRQGSWYIAYTSGSLTGILAAISSGLAVTLLARTAVPAHLTVLNGPDAFPDVEPTELALVAARAQSPEIVTILGRFLIERINVDAVDLCLAEVTA